MGMRSRPAGTRREWRSKRDGRGAAEAAALRGYRRARWYAGIGAGLLALGALRAPAARACEPPAGIERISVGAGATAAAASSFLPVVSADGCVVAFASEASNLIPADNNERADVFVRDRSLGSTQRVPRRPGTGAEPRENSFAPAVSADGRTVAFGSLSTNLVVGDFNTDIDVYVYDLSTEKGWLGSLTFAGEAGGGVPALPPGLSADGRFTAFSAASDKLVADDRNERSDVFVFDRETGGLELMSAATVGTNAGKSADGASVGAAISGDGCRVVFYSEADNLVAGDRNEFADVFVRDRCARPPVTRLVSVGSDGSGADGPSGAPGYAVSISADGRFVAFVSDASNLTPGDANGTTDVFVRDLEEGRTLRVGSEASYPSLSGDGRFVAFQSASDLTGGGVAGRTAVYVMDLRSGELRRVSDAPDGTPAEGAAGLASISADGTTVVFQSEAGNANRVTDIFAVRNPLSLPEPTPTETIVPTESPTAVPPTASPTSTASETPTVPAPMPTPTAGEFCLPLCSLGQSCRAPVAGRILPGTCDPAEDCRCVAVGPSLTPRPSPSARPSVSPTQSATATSSNPGGGGSSGGGCSCRIGTEPAPDAIPPALAILPLVAALLRRQGARRRGHGRGRC